MSGCVWHSVAQPRPNHTEITLRIAVSDVHNSRFAFPSFYQSVHYIATQERQLAALSDIQCKIGKETCKEMVDGVKLYFS